jgi:PAS domain S-box-containing protein
MLNEEERKAKPIKKVGEINNRAAIILQTSIDGFCIIDINGRILEVNPAYCAISGYSKEELIGKQLSDIEANETTDQISEHIREVMEKGYHRFETKHRRKDGTIVDIEVNTQFCDYEQKKIFYCFFRDVTQRKRSEEALRLFSQAVDSSVDGIAMGNLESRITYANETFVKMFGYSRGELIGKKIAFIYAEDQIPKLKKALRATIKGGWTGELVAKKKNGELFPIAVSSSRVVNDKGKVIAHMASHQNITECNVAVKALRLFSQAVDSSIDGVAMGDLEHRIAYANETFVKMFGYSREELIGKEIAFVYADDQIPRLKKALRATIKGSWTGELVGKRKNGELFPIAVSSSRVMNDKGKVIASMASHQDITERKKAEEELKAFEERFSGLAERSFDIIFMTDAQGYLTYISAASERIFHYKPEEMVGTNFKNYLIKSEIPRVSQRFAENMQGRNLRILPMEAMRKDGSHVFVELNSSPILKDDEAVGIQGIIRDVTERKRMEVEREIYKEEILKAQKHAYIGSMGTIVAHQINQPLTMISMFLGRAIEQIEEESCYPSALKNIKESLAEVKKSASIIRKFRQYCQGSVSEATGKVNVSAVADRIVSVLSESAKQARMNISTRDLIGLPEVEINETALEQILLIIIQNAIEAADGRKKYKLNITGKFADEKIELQFSDDCCGIAPENIEKIFEPFFSTRPNHKGMGLGLEIVQQILISCGGEIRVESQLGKGTAFYVTLPVSNVQKS